MRIVDDDVETLLTLDMSLEEDQRRRFWIQQRMAKLRHNEAPIINQADNIRNIQWSVRDNVDILTRPKAKLPGDWAIRYAAMVLVTLIIAYK